MFYNSRSDVGAEPEQASVTPLLARGLCADGWPLVKPWPEVQQHELLRRRDEAARATRSELTDAQQAAARMPSMAEAASVELPWLATPWGALRLHPLQPVTGDSSGQFKAQLDIHLNYVRPRPFAAHDLSSYLRKSLPKTLHCLMTDGIHPLASCGIAFRGEKKEIDKQFKKFCRRYSLQDYFYTRFTWEVDWAVTDHSYDQQREMQGERCEEATRVDYLVALADDHPEIFAKLEASANKLRAARTPELRAAFEAVAAVVDNSYGPYCEPAVATSTLSDALFAMRRSGLYSAMAIPAVTRETPWPEVIEEAKTSAIEREQCDWTDEHWLHAPWGVLRLRFSVVDGVAHRGSARFLFRDARYLQKFDEIARVGALLLAQRYALVPMQWTNTGQPVFALGVNGPLDEDLSALAAMVRSCYAEDIVYSQLVENYAGTLSYRRRGDTSFLSQVARSRTSPRSDVYRFIDCDAVANKLRRSGLSAAGWPLKKPWPEVQQFEMAALLEEEVAEQGMQQPGHHDHLPLADRLPTVAEAEHILVPWIPTRWGALRLHPLQQLEDKKPNLLAAEIDFHWNYVRPRPDSAGEATDFVTGRLGDALGVDMTEGLHPLSTGGVCFIGTSKQIQKQFAKFCQAVEQGALDCCFYLRAEEFILDCDDEATARVIEQGTSVDAMKHLVEDHPALAKALAVAANKINASRTAQHLGEFTRIVSEVTPLLPSYGLTPYGPGPSAIQLAAVLRSMIQRGNIEAMTVPAAARVAPWTEVMAAEAASTHGRQSSTWTDCHWLGAGWGVLRLRFSVTEGVATAGSAQFLFHDQRYDAEWSNMARVASQTLATLYPLLPAQWAEYGTPVFLLGMNGSVDEDLNILASMVTACYAEELLFSRTVWGGVTSTAPDFYGDGFMDFVERQAPGMLQVECVL